MRMMKAWLPVLLWFVLLSAPALAQAVLQAGAAPSGHAPQYLQGGAQAIVGDSGPASGGPAGYGLSELLQVNRPGNGAFTAPYASNGSGPLGTHDCKYDAPTTNPTGGHYLCFDANAQGGGLIAYGAFGTASALPLTMNINGAAYQFPFSLSGILGPSVSVVGDIPAWNNTAGTLLSDSGVAVADLTPLTSPHFTGVPTAPTATAGTNTTQLATTAFVQTALTGAPGYVTVNLFTGTGTITASTAPQAIMVDKNTPAATSVVLPAASNWPNCPTNPASCPVYRVKDLAGNSYAYPITVTASDGANFVGGAPSSSFVINTEGAEYGFTLAGSVWSVN